MTTVFSYLAVAAVLADMPQSSSQEASKQLAPEALCQMEEESHPPPSNQSGSRNMPTVIFSQSVNDWRGKPLSEDHVNLLLDLAIYFGDSFGVHNTKWYNEVAAVFAERAGRPYSGISVHRTLDVQVTKWRAHKRVCNTSGYQPRSDHWAQLANAWKAIYHEAEELQEQEKKRHDACVAERENIMRSMSRKRPLDQAGEYGVEVLSLSPLASTSAQSAPSAPSTQTVMTIPDEAPATPT